MTTGLQVLSVETKYERETGLKAWRAERRLARAREVLSRTDTTLHQWYFALNKDRKWNTRKNRDTRERAAVLLGETSRSGTYHDEHVLWFVPLTAHVADKYTSLGGGE